MAGGVPGDWKNHRIFLESTRTEDAVILAVIVFEFSWYMAKYTNVNKFSLQAMYRSRLIRAYLGASNVAGKRERFTGFDQTDNFLLKNLSADKKPFHIVNIALNLVAGERLAGQQRKAASFTVSALHSGTDDIFYRRSCSFGGEGGISLAPAVPLSAAAPPPTIACHPPPPLSLTR